MTDATGKTILIVDDEAANRNLLEALVLSLGHVPEQARDGFEAIERLTPQIDLVLMDIMMPGIDGFEAVRRIRTHAVYGDIPIIMVTALSGREDRLAAVEAGANDFIAKPVDKTELRVRLNSLLAMKEARDALRTYTESLEDIVQKRTAELSHKNRELEQEIAERLRIEAELRQSRAYLMEAEKIAHLGSWVWDIGGNQLKWSDEIYAIFGLSPFNFEASYGAFLKAVYPEDRPLVENAVDQALKSNASYEIEHRILRPDGEIRYVHEKARLDLDDIGNPVRMVGTVQDITEKKHLETELRKLSTAIEESINIAFITDYNGSIEYVNPMFEKITGYVREEALGQNPRILASGETPKEVYTGLWKTIKAGRPWRGDFKNRRKNGDFYYGKGLISPIRNDKGEITHFLAIQEDTTEKVLAEQKARYLSTHDPVTGLLNRDSFLATFEKLLIPDYHGVLILADVDDFKLVNEAFGHNFADQYLKELGVIFQKTVSSLDPLDRHYIGRYGEDEFIVFLLGVSPVKGLEIAENIRNAVAGHETTDTGVRYSVSMGLVQYPEHGLEVRELFKRADAALLHAKRGGKNRCHLFAPRDEDIVRTQPRLNQKLRILKALEEDRFEPWFQPILSIGENAVHHYEVLARMRDEQGHIILPGAFIPAAEALGLISSIDRAITRKAIHIQARLNQEGNRLSFAMNLSAIHLGDMELFAFLQQEIEACGADPDCLVFEITETAAIRDLDIAVRFIQALKQLGCRFSLDDFGVGYTSFVYLREMQVDYIKIDGQFIKRLPDNPHDQGIVRAIVTIAKELGIHTIAEFVETPETLKMLKAFGVDFAQGFLIGRPEARF